MEPKFQSSFIPKGPIASSPQINQVNSNRKPARTFLSIIATTIFIVSILAAAGAFGYKFYLQYSINQMETDLKAAQDTLRPDLVKELTRINNRLVSPKKLVSSHEVLTPDIQFSRGVYFENCAFLSFMYSVNDQGQQVTMSGQARGYSALAFQADVFNRNPFLKDSVFSNLILNERGEVAFSFRATIDPELISYERKVEQLNLPAAQVVLPVIEDFPGSTASSSVALPATSTQNQNE